MNVVVLDYEENFLTFLDPELLTITETTEIGGLPSLSVEYIMNDIEEAKLLFKVGNKIWLSNHPTLDDRLYVINTKVKRDYFKENNVVFDVEDVLVELNYAPIFSQTDLTTKNGFTLSTSNGEQNVLVDYKALKFWFGDFFNIGIVQDCLNTTIQKISPTGTMTKMELLRFIEEHTGNVFITRYEKGMLDNVIHRYLDYLNPNGNDSNFTVSFEYKPTRLETADAGDVEEDDEVLPAPDIVHNIENLLLSVKNSDGEVINNLQWTGDELQINNNAPVVVISLKYTKPSLQITVNNRTFDTSKAQGIEDVSYNDNYDLIVNVGGLKGNTETYIDNPINTVIPDAILPNHTIFEFVDTYTGTVFFRHELNPMLGDVHTEVLDLAYNTENIEYEVDESDTFNAIAPILSLDQSGGATNGLSFNDLTKIINRWKDLAVTKGEPIPMIVQKISSSEAPTTTYMNLSDPTKNYYIRPLHPQDNIQSGSGSTYEYWKGTAYWTAPFTKNKGEMFIKIDEETGAEYNKIRTKQDITNPYGAGYLPKIGQVSTSDEDPYAIYNDVAMKLKDKRYPSIDVEVDVANYRNGNYNNYGLYDKVYVRIPGFEQLVTAIVKKTTKSFHDIGENKVELTNFTVNTRVITKETGIFGDNLSFKYPNKGNLNVILQDLTSEDVGLANKLITLTLYTIDDSGTQKFKKAYNKRTNSQGKVTLPLKLNPGNYVVEANFGGDIEYSPSTATYDVNVSGKLEKAKSTKNNTKSKTTKKYKTKKRYWSKYGESPDNKKYVMAVGRASAPGELGKYGYGFYESKYENYCPKCHKKGTLFWDIFYAGNETTDWGHVRKTGNGEGGSAEGHVFCSNQRCDGDWSIYGKEHGYTNTRLKRKGKLKKSSKKRAYTLRNGKMLYDTVKVEVKSKNNSKKKTSHKTLTTVNSKVKEKALKIATGKGDYENAKLIARWCGTNIHYGYSEGFTKSPVSVLNSRSGNCCSQTEFMFHMMDAAGVTETYDLYYVFVCCNPSRGVGHVFGKMVNKTSKKWWYVDPCKADPWHHYVTGWGSPPGRRQTKYPSKPF